MSNLTIGIVGLPNVGKSTLFQALTNKQVNIANYPFATINPNVGVVEVLDDRLFKLAEFSKSKKIVPAIVEFYDIAGLVKNAHTGEGLGNQFLAQIREVKLILHLVRCFKDSQIVHLEGEINPLRDIEIIIGELIFKDLETIDKVYNRLLREAKTNDKQKVKDLEVVSKVKEILDKGELLINYQELINEEIIKGLQLLTSKPQFFILNGREQDVSIEVIEKIKSLNCDYLILDLSQKVDLDLMIKKSYEYLGLISFFTTGEDETRAWTIKNGTKAKEAAGVIHSDFEKKFIKAEVINWEKLLELGSWQNAKAKGLIKSEGKDYVINDGDVIEIKHGA